MSVPTDFSSLSGWWKADAITGKSDGDSITQWDDSSGLAHHLTGGSPLYKTNILNSLPVVRFDGTDDTLTAAFAETQPTTRFWVVRFRSAYPPDREVSDGNNSLTCLLGRRSATQIDAYSGASISISTTPESPHIYSCVYNGASSSLRVDGGTAVTGTVGGSEDTGGVQLAARGDSTTFADIDVAEVIDYGDAKNDADVLSIVDYLNTKWFVAPVVTPTLFVVQSGSRFA